ncbi:hypothetical protein FRC20_007118 [Serendipita sp. 405]|nr:hypothetical protein FRC20_007118 [Serendipita sp. 405]
MSETLSDSAQHYYDNVPYPFLDHDLGPSPPSSLTASANLCDLQTMLRILLKGRSKATALVYREFTPQQTPFLTYRSPPPTPDGSFMFEDDEPEESFQSLKANYYTSPRTGSGSRRPLGEFHVTESELDFVDSEPDDSESNTDSSSDDLIPSIVDLTDSLVLPELPPGRGVRIHVKWNTMAQTIMGNVIESIAPGAHPVAGVQMFVQDQVSSLRDAINQRFTVQELEVLDEEWIVIPRSG